MALKISKPTSPGRRAHISLSRENLHKGRPHKSLTKSINKSFGRNNHGHITTRHRGAGHKRLYRQIDFKRNLYDITGRIERLEYDPNRSSHIALVKYDNGDYRYILAPEGLSSGDKIVSSMQSAPPEKGNAMKLKHIPVGSQVHNIEIKIGKGGQMARSAGAYCTLMAKDAENATLRLASGEVRYINLNCFATIGALGNSAHKNTSDGKAGRSRWKGKRPRVRGVAMNPVDHPHGGGEGKTSGGRHPCSPWGQKAKGLKTRSNKKTQHMIIRSRKRK